MRHRGRKNIYDRMYPEPEEKALTLSDMPPGWPKRQKPRRLNWWEIEQVKRHGRLLPRPSQKRPHNATE